MTNLEIAKQLIKENYRDGRLGLFDRPSIIDDPKTTLYSVEDFRVDLCYTYEYFECIGLSNEDFEELYSYYNQLRHEKEYN